MFSSSGGVWVRLAKASNAARTLQLLDAEEAIACCMFFLGQEGNTLWERFARYSRESANSLQCSAAKEKQNKGFAYAGHVM